MEKKTILITGATGFLGSALLREFIDSTDLDIIVLKRSFSNTRRIKDLLNNKRIKTYDIDKCEVESVFAENKLDVIVHCATEYGRNCDSEKVLLTNLVLPVKLIENAIKNKVELFINTDSYFNKENLSYMYLQNYSLSKKSLLMWLKGFSKNIKIINVVLEHIYGENDNPEKFVYTMVKKIALEQVESVDCTNGEQKRDFIYIKDVCRAYIYLLNYGLTHNFRLKSYDLGTGNVTAIRDLILKIKELSGSPTKINFGALKYRDDEIMISRADTVELNDLGWFPKYTVESGLKSMIDSERTLSYEK